MAEDYNALDISNKDVTSKFNEAKLQLYRLNYSWIKCANYATGGDLVAWKWELDNIWRELSSDASDKEKEQNNKLRTMISLAERKGTKALFYRVLEERQIFLRGILESSGKGSSKKHQDEDTFD